MKGHKDIKEKKVKADMAVNKKADSGEVDGLKSQLVRALADYDNLRKRTEIEKSEWMKFAKQEFLVKLLPVIDSLELAQNYLNDKGLELALIQFKKVLDEEGIEEIAEGKEFNEQVHEAVDSVAGGKKGEIAEFLQKGYIFNDGDLIRPAKVRVYKGEN